MSHSYKVIQKKNKQVYIIEDQDILIEILIEHAGKYIHLRAKQQSV